MLRSLRNPSHCTTPMEAQIFKIHELIVSAYRHFPLLPFLARSTRLLRNQRQRRRPQRLQEVLSRIRGLLRVLAPSERSNYPLQKHPLPCVRTALTQRDHRQRASTPSKPPTAKPKPPTLAKTRPRRGKSDPWGCWIRRWRRRTFGSRRFCRILRRRWHDWPLYSHSDYVYSMRSGVNGASNHCCEEPTIICASTMY